MAATFDPAPPLPYLVELLSPLDACVAALIGPLAAWILLSGLDDLFVLTVFLAYRSRKPPPVPPTPAAERRVAILVPLWQEDAVIARMLLHNLAAIRYSNYDFFVGLYPNDPATHRAVSQVAARHPRLHLCFCPHDGPTSKADCLNWIFQSMLLFEAQTAARFDIVLTHDAEDVMHPDSLRLVNRYINAYDMIQTPVFPLPTPVTHFTHGLYCDDFAEFHSRDLPVRSLLGGFIPSSGVGAAYSRHALELLAQNDSNRVFRPDCLTEDYENGLRLHRLGCRQRFLDNPSIATREFFPQSFRAARRQRTRWITGIALQSWQRHGWSAGPGQLYWLWRDRKGLLTSPAGLLANILFFYGAATFLLCCALGAPWGLSASAHNPLLPATAALSLTHLLARSAFSARIYGWRFALGVPLRAVFGNLLNSCATFAALWNFFRARLLRLPLVWVKTEHAYPSLAALTPHKRLLGEILVSAGYLSPARLAAALSSKPPQQRLGEHLLDLRLLDEDQLYHALSLQHGLPAAALDPQDVPKPVARSLPLNVVRRHRVVPFGVSSGHLHLATTELPTDLLLADLARLSRLTPSFTLITPANFQRFCQALL